MFIQVARYTIPDIAKADAIYAKAVAMWASTKCLNMTRYAVIAEGTAGVEILDQPITNQVVVLRFDNRNDWESARESIAEPRAALITEMAEAGIVLDTLQYLDEIVNPAEVIPADAPADAPAAA